MSSIRAIELPTQPIEALATEAYHRPRTVRPVAGPSWAAQVEEALRVTARFGCSPTPTILLGFTFALAAALRS